MSEATGLINLNGEWAFAFCEEALDSDALSGRLDRKINVPFTYETELSGIHDTSQHNAVWYSRSITGRKGLRTIVNFDGADYDTEVYVNGRLVGTHRGAYSRFSFDVTDFLIDHTGVLTVKCVDRNLPLQASASSAGRRQATAAGMFRQQGSGKPCGLNMWTISG